MDSAVEASLAATAMPTFNSPYHVVNGESLNEVENDNVMSDIGSQEADEQIAVRPARKNSVVDSDSENEQEQEEEVYEEEPAAIEYSSEEEYYEDSEVGEEDSEEEYNDSDDEVYGSRGKGKNKSKKKKSTSQKTKTVKTLSLGKKAGPKRKPWEVDSEEDDEEDEDADEFYRTQRKIKRTQPKKKGKSDEFAVSDEEEEEEDYFEDAEFNRRPKKVVFDGTIYLPGEEGRIVEGLFDWNEEKGECLVKWKGRSHWHDEWISVEEINKKYNGQRKVENFLRKIEDEQVRNEAGGFGDENLGFLELMREALPDYLIPERIIAMHSEGEGQQWYLIKWKSLGYSECTWEGGEDERLTAHQGLIDDFLARQYCNNKSTVKKQFRKLAHQPDYLGNGQVELRQYQLDGLNWLLYSWCRGNNVILADEMGLGKTIQSVSFLTVLFHDYGFKGPNLVVVPLSTIDAWQREFERWGRGLNVVVYVGSADSRAVIRKYEFYGNQSVRFNVLLTTYEMILKDSTILQDISWKQLLVDEGHRLKNSSSQLYEVLYSLVPHANRLLITGTPLQNSLGELWCLLRFLMPSKFDDYEAFLSRYSLEEDDDDEEGGGARLSELHALIKPHILRRLKKDVETSLPGKTEKIIRVDLSGQQKNLYKTILTRNYRELKRLQEGSGRSTGNLLNVLGELKKVCNHPILLGNGRKSGEEGGEIEVLLRDERVVEEGGKLSLLRRMLKRLKAEGHRVLIFSQSVKMLDVLEGLMRIDGYAFQRLDGSKTSTHRQVAINSFNNPQSNDFVFLLSTRAGGLGINLATADTVIIYDSDWNPQNDLQAMARAHRIGQQKEVRIFRLVSAGTVEEEILERAKRKMVLDHLVIQRLERKRERGSSGNNNDSIGDRGDLQAILKFGAQALFNNSTPALPAPAIDLDSVMSPTMETSTTTDETDEFLNQFRMAELGVSTGSGGTINWEEIIPEADRLRMEEEERRREEEEKEIELQEALLMTATTRKRKPVTNSVIETGGQVKSLGRKGKSESNSEENNIITILLPDQLDDKIIYEEFDLLCRYGRCQSSELETSFIKALEGLNSSDTKYSCKLTKTGPILTLNMTLLIDRIRSLSALTSLLSIDRTIPVEEALRPLSSFRFTHPHLKAPIGNSWPIKPFLPLHDACLLVALATHGYGNWSVMRAGLDGIQAMLMGKKKVGEAAAAGAANTGSCWMKVSVSQITRRVEYLLKLVGDKKPVNKKEKVVKVATKVKGTNNKKNTSSTTEPKQSTTATTNTTNANTTNTTTTTTTTNANTTKGALTTEDLIKKYRKAFKSQYTTLTALESLQPGRDSAPALTAHLRTLGDHISSFPDLKQEGEGEGEGDEEAWKFVGCFWPWEPVPTAADLRKLYESAKSKERVNE